MKRIVSILLLPSLTLVGIAMLAEKSPNVAAPAADQISTATFAGGCFWCVEADFEKLPGVVEVISGYACGQEPNPTYSDVSSGRTGYMEAVQVHYDPSKVSYPELLDYFWRHINPADAGGQFVDRGPQYRAAIFYHDSRQHKLAEASKQHLQSAGKFQNPIVTELLP